MNVDQIEVELRNVKMLLILQLLMHGAKQNEIAAVMGVSEATVSRLIPKSVKESMKGATKCN